MKQVHNSDSNIGESSKARFLEDVCKEQGFCKRLNKNGIVLESGLHLRLETR